VHEDERANRHWETISRLTQLNGRARPRWSIGKGRPIGSPVPDAVTGFADVVVLRGGRGRGAERRPGSSS
jgi:hypothetical protein